MIAAIAGIMVLDGYLACQNDTSRCTNGLLVGLILTALAIAATAELRRLALAKGLQPPLVPLAVAVAIITLEPFWTRCLNLDQGITVIIAIILGLFCNFFAQYRKMGSAGAIGNMSVAAFTIIYIGIGLWFVVRIRMLGGLADTIWGQIGPLAMFLTCAKACDIGAYLTGYKFGKHKWVPKISPGKTWEGLIGGIALTVIVASLFSVVSGIMGIAAAIVMAIIVAITGQLGDLLESMLKRDAQKKDSASLIPQFGGALDLLDSVIASAPFAYLAYSIIL